MAFGFERSGFSKAFDPVVDGFGADLEAVGELCVGALTSEVSLDNTLSEVDGIAVHDVFVLNLQSRNSTRNVL